MEVVKGGSIVERTRGAIEMRLKRYVVVFHLNVVDFRCMTMATNKRSAIADVLFNINLRGLKKINGITVTELEKTK